MGNKLRLFWYKYAAGRGNFGDELNPYIIKMLSTLHVEHIDLRYLLDDKISALRTIISAYYHKQITFSIFWRYVYYNFILRPKVLVAIGSVIQDIHYTNCQVWGSGIIDAKSNFKDADFRAVRGLYSQKRLIELGYKCPQVVGDPAILLPLIYKPTSTKRYRMGVVPHYVHYRDIKERIVASDVLVINLLDDIEDILNQLYSCEYTLSTSLHGIIASHVYGIPSAWVEFTQIDGQLKGDNVKFKDYFSSVGINEYEALEINTADLRSDEIIAKFRNNDIELLPTMTIFSELQRNLLNAAPFSLREAFL